MKPIEVGDIVRHERGNKFYRVLEKNMAWQQPHILCKVVNLARTRYPGHIYYARPEGIRASLGFRFLGETHNTAMVSEDKIVANFGPLEALP